MKHLDLKRRLRIQLRNGRPYYVAVGGTDNKRWLSIFSKCIESLGKAKPKFWEEFDKYDFAARPEYLVVGITYELPTGGKSPMHVEYFYWDELFPESLLRDFDTMELAIPDDLTSEQELEMEKTIIKRIWDGYKQRRLP